VLKEGDDDRWHVFADPILKATADYIFLSTDASADEELRQTILRDTKLL